MAKFHIQRNTAKCSFAHSLLLRLQITGKNDYCYYFKYKRNNGVVLETHTSEHRTHSHTHTPYTFTSKYLQWQTLLWNCFVEKFSALVWHGGTMNWLRERGRDRDGREGELRAIVYQKTIFSTTTRCFDEWRHFRHANTTYIPNLYYIRIRINLKFRKTKTIQTMCWLVY